MQRFRLAALVSALVLSPVDASLANDPREAATERRDALYQQLLASPNDPELMLDYARASVEAEDFEAAISTLERALTFSPNNPQLQMELGASYFRIGAWQVAEFYFTEARAAGLPAVADERAEEYLDAIAKRTSRSRFTGSAMFGVVASSNANLGPDDRIVRFFGLPAQLDPSDTAQAGTGLRAVARIRHDYDLGTPDLETWRTEGAFYGVRYFEQDAGDLTSVAITTGPSLALDDSAYGWRGRPFLGLRLTGQDNQHLFQEYGGGFEVSNTFDKNWSGVGRIGAGWRDYRDESDDFDALVVRGVASGIYSPRRGLSFVGTVIGETDRAEEDFQSNYELGFRAAAILDYDPKIKEAENLWTVSGFAQMTGRWFDEADPSVDPDTRRRDTDLRLGAAHLFRFSNGWGLQIDADALLRDSTISNFELDSVNGGVSVVYEF